MRRSISLRRSTTEVRTPLHFHCPVHKAFHEHPRWLTTSCVLGAIDDFRVSIGHLLPNQSATCFVSMLDEGGNLLAETPGFPAGDVGRSSTTGSALRITGAASYSTATLLSSRFTDAATSNATVTASSSMSLSTAASSSLPLTAPSTTHGLIMTSTVFATTPAKITSSGSNPNVRVQTVMGILAGAVAFALVIGS